MKVVQNIQAEFYKKQSSFLLDSWLHFNAQENSEEKSEITKFYPLSLQQNYVTFLSSSYSYLFSGCSYRYSWVPTSRSTQYHCSSI